MLVIEMASATSLFPLTFKSYSLPSSLPLNPSLSLSSSSSSSSSSSRVSAHISNRHNAHCSKGISFNGSNSYPCSLGEKRRSLCPSRLICRAAEYKFPDPIPEFADAVSAHHLFVEMLRSCNFFLRISFLGF